MDEIICIGCGCSDLDGCEPDDDGKSCSWAAINDDVGVGLCSRCAGKPIEELVSVVAHPL